MDRIRRRNLPHWDVPGAAYFVTTCLDGSIPAQGMLDLERYRKDLRDRPTPKDKTEAEWSAIKSKLQFARLDRWLDAEPALRWLEKPDIAKIVHDAFYYYAGNHYDLLGFVVMPSHIHWVFQPLAAWFDAVDWKKRTPRQHIVHGLNLYTARECNAILERQGTFWQHEGYDHWIRDVDELERILEYIDMNPVKAGLVKTPEEWPYSSAYDRRKYGIAFGEPMTRDRGGKFTNLPVS